MADESIVRRPPRHETQLLAGPQVAIELMEPQARFSLRMREQAAAEAGEAAGFRLDQALLRCQSAGDRLSARLGPDEWLLIAPEADERTIAAEIETALAGRFYALIDIGHSMIGVWVTGAGAAAVLNSGCPLDLREPSFPVGAATRTLLGKAEIVLMRLEPTRYRVECRRSFAAYVEAFLRESARDVLGPQL
jgi:sarcosine oxidase subunit gamma